MVCLHPDDYNGFDKKSDTEYDYLEIGTCDWDTFSMTKPNLKGIIVEPIDIYINNIPFNKNVIKQKCAISTKNGTDFMYYIPPETIERTGIVNCYRGMNKLSNYHMGHNEIKDLVVKQETEVFTYKTLLTNLNVTYVDFLKIDTEGHDCDIINDILDTMTNLPKYIYFENNGLTELQKRTDTIYRLWQYGFVHIFTEDDNTFMYNCKNHFERHLVSKSVSLPMSEEVKGYSHFFQNVHSYIEFGQYDLFKRILKMDTIDIKEQNLNEISKTQTPEQIQQFESLVVTSCDVIWTTHVKDEYLFYKDKAKKIVSIVHGGGCAYRINFNKNILVKSVDEWINLKNRLNCGFFIGKYEVFSNNFDTIYNYRNSKYQEIYNKNNFLILHGFFKYNSESIKSTYNVLKNNYQLDLYGFDADLGWADTTSGDPEVNILSKYKFNLHLKGLGYFCNSVLFSMMAGIPVIMSHENYYKTLYYQFIPKELIIFYDNNNFNDTRPCQIIPVLERVKNMSLAEYTSLSKKVYIHGNYFRKYYQDELKHLYYFINELNETP